MKLALIPFTLFVAFYSLGAADVRPKIESILNKEFYVEDHWAGQSFTLVKKGDEIEMIWRVLGSGRPILSESRIPVTMNSEYQIIAKATDTNCPREIKVEIHDFGEVRAFIDGIRIYISSNIPNK